VPSGPNIYRGILVAFLLFTVLLGVSSYSYLNSIIETRAQNAFLLDAARVETTLRGVIFNHEKLLLSVKGLFLTNRAVGRKEWDVFLRTLSVEDKFPNMTSISYATYAVGPEADAVYADIKTDPDLPTETCDSIIIPVTPSGTERIITTYVYPDWNLSGVGIDLTRGPDLIDTFRSGRDSGEVVATAPQTLPTGAKAFTIVMPIYRNDAPVSTSAERRAALKGYVIGTLRIPSFFDVSARRVDIPTGMDVGLSVGDERQPDLEGSDRPDFPFGIDTLEFDSFSQETTYDLFGQRLTLVFHAPGTYGLSATERLLPIMVPASCAILFLLLVATLFSFTRMNVRARRLAERMTRDLSEAQRTFEATVEQLPVGVYLATVPEGKPLLINHIGMELMRRGFEPGAKRTSYTDVYRPLRENGEDYPVDELPPNIAIKTEKPSMKDDIVLERSDGKRTPVRVTSAPVVDTTGKTFAVVVVYDDIGKEREIDRAKSEFVSFAAHQLKTPLTSTRWFYDLLDDQETGRLNAEQKRYLKELREINRNMFDLVESLLNVSRIELGVLKPAPEPFMLPDLIDSILKEMAPTIRRKKLKIAPEYDRVSTVIGDKRMFRIILQNLISNALKYTQNKGKILVSLSKKGKTVQVSIKDTGYGIPKRQQERVFTKLFRADNVQDKQIEGTGLGLYLVKAIVDKLGGHITFESKEGKGSTFLVTLPLA